MDDAGSEEKQELICSECEQQATEIATARARVIYIAGVTFTMMVPVVVLLSFADSLLNHRPWVLDDRILYDILLAAGSITAFAWRSKPDDHH